MLELLEDDARLLEELATTELLIELLELLTGALLLDELDTGILLALDEELLATLELIWLEDDDDEAPPSLP